MRSKFLDFDVSNLAAEEGLTVGQEKGELEEALRRLRKTRLSIVAFFLLLIVWGVGGSILYNLYEAKMRGYSWCIWIAIGCGIMWILVAIGRTFESHKKAEADFNRATAQCASAWLKVIDMVRKRRMSKICVLEQKIEDFDDELCRLKAEQEREDEEWRRRQAELKVLQEQEQSELDSQIAEHERNIQMETQIRDAFDKSVESHHSAEMKRQTEENALQDGQRMKQEKLLSGLCAVDQMINDLEESFRAIVDSVNKLTQEDIHE